MLDSITKRLGTLVIAFLIAGAIAQAANVDKALADSESRRKTAENGAREIKKKSSGQAAQVRAAYTAAANEHNAWLDQVCRAIEENGPSTLDASAAAKAAASSLVDWVAVRNRALDTPVMKSDLAEGVKKSVVQDMIDIATSSLKSAQGADKQKRMKIAASLNERLRWKTWEDVG
jgi:hypothetical protein